MKKKFMFFLTSFILLSLIGCTVTNPSDHNSKLNSSNEPEHNNKKENSSNDNKTATRPKATITKPNEKAEKLIAEYKDISFQFLSVEGIPLICAYKDNNEVKPFIVLMHGIGGCKEDFLWNAINFAEKGYYAVIMDAVAHGETNDQPTMANKIMVETGRNIEKLVEYFQQEPYVDVERLGVMGSSMGGCSAYWYGANGKYRPKAVAPIVATPDYETFTPQSAASCCIQYGKCVEPIWSQEELLAYRKENSPIYHPDGYMDTALFMFNGKKDDVISYAGSQKLYTELINKKHPNITYTLDENMGHDISQDGYLKMLEFFDHNLKE